MGTINNEGNSGATVILRASDMINKRIDKAIQKNIVNDFYTSTYLRFAIRTAVDAFIDNHNNDKQREDPEVKFGVYKGVVTLIKVLLDVFKTLPEELREHILNKGLFDDK